MATASTSQGGEYFQWRFAGPINVNTLTQNPVSCMKFDPHEELLWIGSATGKLSSYLPGNHFQRYTACAISNVSPIHSIEPTESVIFSLTDKMLRGTTRQGIPVSRFTSSSMTKMMASCHMPGTSTFILGGRQSKMIHYDFVKEKEIRTADMRENAATIIRFNGANTFTADDSGFIHIKNAKNCETIHSMQCHNERVLDFDVQGNFLVTCGVTINDNYSRNKNCDNFVKVFDLRTYKALGPLGTPTPPVSVRFMPSYCERVCITYQTNGGLPNLQKDWCYETGVKMFDLNSQANFTSFPFESFMISAVDFSTTKNYFAAATHCGVVQVFADRDHPIVNENSKETVFAAPPVQPPISFSIDDTTQTFGSIPIPFPTEPLASDWPIEYTQMVYRRLKPNPERDQTSKQLHYTTQVANPRMNTKLKHYNVVPYILEHEEAALSHVEQVENQAKVGKIKVSKLYKKRPPPPLIAPNRRGASHQTADDTLETYTWNVIRHVTMQSTYAMNLLANCLVQVVYSLSPLRKIVLSHICENDSCITCELHFLFTAFSSKIGQNTGIMTTNLAWALARNGVCLKTGGVLGGIHQVIHKTLNDVSDKDSSSSISSKLDRHLRCVRCQGLQPVDSNSEHLIKLSYSTIHQASFCQLIEKALHLGRGSLDVSDEKECAECKQMSRMECKRKVRELSPLLLIDTNSASDEFVEFWRRQLSIFEHRPISNRNTVVVPESPSDKKICRYGTDCRHMKTCKFAHGKVDWNAEQSKLLDDVDLDGWKHYIPSRIAAQLCEGIIRLSDISSSPDYDEPNAVIYELETMVDVIGNGESQEKEGGTVWTHPVTLLRQSPVISTAWTLINEQLVSRLHDDEARHVDARWKIPVLLAYKKRNFEVNNESSTVPDELFFAEQNLAESGAKSLAIQAMEELPKEGELVGLDAEFIKIKTDLLEFGGKTVQMRAVGRASCVDSNGEKIIFDDHIKLTKDVEVVDYLTKFSGIVESDLNVTSSDKYLTSHKRLLLRMHVLIQRGVIFVGHALHNDFTVLNVHVAEPQIIDTVILLRLDSQRMLSLQFLAREILGETIQSEAHDSVVDAKYALKLYRKYLSISEQGNLASEMRRIYAILPCPSPNQTASPLVVLTQRKTPDDGTSVDTAPKSV